MGSGPVRLGLFHFNDLVDSSLASHKLSAQPHTPEEMKVCADHAGTDLVPVTKRGRPASEVNMKDPHRIIPIREERIGSIEERPEYLQMKLGQKKEKDERGGVCTLKLCGSPGVERRAHVGQLIRYRGGDTQDLDEEEPDAPASNGAAREVFGKMREGRFVMFAVKGESPSNLRIAEVLKTEEDLVTNVVLCRSNGQEL